jgi:hypothetical protein
MLRRTFPRPPDSVQAIAVAVHDAADAPRFALVYHIVVVFYPPTQLIT